MRLALLLLLVCAIAQAAPLQVQEKPIELLHAERLDITERFELVRVELAIATIGSTQLTNVEMSEIMTPASTYVSRGHWTYAITLQEREADGVESGVFDVELWSGESRVRTLRLTQNVSEPLLKEGARATFDLGEELPAAPLFVVKVREIAFGPTFALTSGFDLSTQYVWEDDAGVENPLIEVSLDDTVTFVITNGDGTAPHNFQIQDGTNPIPATEDVTELGEQTSLVWHPPAAGEFRYECRYHSSMSGIIEVAE